MARATWNGETLAESSRYQEVEGNIYFPPESVKWDHFKQGDRQYTCPWKGKARYYDLFVAGKVNRNAAWIFPEPKPAAECIKGHVAFGEGVEIEA